MLDVSYVPGPLTAVTGGQCWVLVAASPDSPAVTRIWQQFGQGAAPDALLAGLLADGIGGVPGFALLTTGTDGQHRLFCRGTVRATVDAERIDGAGLLTWREHVFTGAERVFLGEPPADTALRLPAASGVLLAGCVAVDFTERPKKPIVFFPETITVPSFDGDGEPVPDLAVAAPAQVTADPGSPAFVASPPPVPSPPSLVQEPAVQEPAAQEPAGFWNGDDPEIAPEYDFFWERTQARSVEDAAIRGPGDGGLFSAQPGGLIDVPPWLGNPAETESTVKRDDLLGRPLLITPPDRIGPLVPALICQNGHVNPPGGSACRRCAAPLPRTLVSVPRPVLGVLRLSLGDVITLDRGVLMGRNPRMDAIGLDSAGGPGNEERPHVVKLPSADGDVSRTHLHVTLDGWQVLVTDLNSTNGTVLTLPGRGPQQLRPGESVPITPGTVVTLAEGIDFRYEVTD